MFPLRIITIGLLLFIATAAFNLRLPSDTLPRLYKIELNLNSTVQNLTFSGNSTVLIDVLKPTTTVIFHASAKLKLVRRITKLIDQSGRLVKPIKQIWLVHEEFYILKFENKLIPGNYSLKLAWIGRVADLNDLPKPLGLIRYKDENIKESK